MRWLKSLYVQVLLGIVLGVLVGYLWPQFGTSLKPLGDAFVKLIRMVVAPVIFCTVALGVAHMRDVSKFGRVGGKALLYFEVVSTIALMIGIGVGLWVRPGEGFPVKLDLTAVESYVTRAKEEGLKGAMDGLRFIRHTPILLAAISLDLFAVLFGGAVALLPVYAKDILHVGTVEYGFLRSAAAVGGATMALLLTRHQLRRRVGRTLFIAVATFGVGTVVFGLSRNYYLSLIALAVLGCADMISVYVRSNVVPLATSQDHKRIGEGDTGPNTGGMGAYAPAPVCPPAMVDELMSTMLQPTVDGMAASGRPYRGVLYAGVMLTALGPRLLEFNCRF